MSQNASPQTARTPGAHRAQSGEHFFDLGQVNQIMGGPTYSPVFGGCVEGDRMIVDWTATDKPAKGPVNLPPGMKLPF
ncbi:MAG: hypothetical protein RJA29_683, partial [Pseudomonadota bacterium]